MGVVRDLPEERRVLALPITLDALSRDEVSTILLLAQLSGYFLNRLPYISLYYDIWPLDFSTGIPEESGV